jgi:tetratricopeptide (TPR) repeat protein
MVNKTVKILAAIILIALSLYVVTQNSAQSTVYLSPGFSVSANTGVVLIFVFVLGVVCASLVAGYFALKAALRESKLQKQERDRQAFFQTMAEARSLLAAGEWEKAKSAWEKIVKRDPASIIARVELSRSLEAAGNLIEALKAVDAARLKEPANIEVLFRAADLNLALNNKTAAIDNLALIQYHHSCLKAARLARDLSEEQSRLEDAFEYQEKVAALGESTEELRPVQARLEFKKLIKELPAEKEGRIKLISALRDHVKRYPEFAPALARLAKEEAEEGRIDDAAQLLIKAAKASGDAAYWRQASKLWVENNMTDRAIAAARSGGRSCLGAARVNAEVFLLRLLLQLGKLDEAKPVLDGLPALAKEQKVEIDSALQRELLLLESLYLNQAGEHQAATALLQKLCQGA